ncbi:MAG: prephenate dehydrogenase [Candidatus Thermoplasmatota archaeon]|nr:prephenate dehydrogenase [Candidatus Thermoplasmatota archaeon]
MKKALVIGGKGGMGKWLAKFLRSKGYEVFINDPQGRVRGFKSISDFKDALNFKLIALATPISNTRAILENIIKEDVNSLIFDLCSVKSPIKNQLLKGAREGKKIVSIHPMFGPEVENLKSKNILVCDCGNAQAVKEIKGLFKGSGARILELDLEQHDKFMAYVLSLTHAVNIIFYKTLTQSSLLKRLIKVSSLNFDAQLKLATKIIAQDPKLCYEIQSNNPYSIKATKDFTNLFHAFQKILATKDLKKFIKFMR